MFCTNCGDNVSPNQKFCTSCGAKINDDCNNNSTTTNNSASNNGGNASNNNANDFAVNNKVDANNNSNSTNNNTHSTSTTSTHNQPNSINFDKDKAQAKAQDILNNVKLKLKALTKQQLAIIAAVALVVIVTLSVIRINNVNSSQEKVVKNFFVALDKVDYDKCRKSFYKANDDELSRMDMKSSTEFVKTANELKKEFEKECGTDWVKKLKFEVCPDGVYVTFPDKDRHREKVPTISVDKKYYIDISSFHF